MGWTVILEDYRGNEIKKLSKEFTPTSFAHFESEKFKTLRYIDPYDDTTFNSIMCKELVSDLNELWKDESTNVRKQIEEILELTSACMNEPHTYVKFYGD